MLATPYEEQLDKALGCIGVDGAGWQLSTKGTRTFLLVYLKLEANIWHHLLKSKLIPTTCNASITKEIVLLLFCIMEDLSIDVGQLIENKITGVEKPKQGNLFIPNLIMQTLYSLKCIGGRDWSIPQRRGVINEAAIERLKVVDYSKRGGNIVFAIKEVTTNQANMLKQLNSITGMLAIVERRQQTYLSYAR